MRATEDDKILGHINVKLTGKTKTRQPMNAKKKVDFVDLANFNIQNLTLKKMFMEQNEKKT
jgi:hypothetical protein